MLTEDGPRLLAQLDERRNVCHRSHLGWFAVASPRLNSTSPFQFFGKAWELSRLLTR